MLRNGRPVYPFSDLNEPLWFRFSERATDERGLTVQAIRLPEQSCNRKSPGNEIPGHYTDVVRSPKYHSCGVFELPVRSAIYERDTEHLAVKVEPIHRPVDENYYHSQLEATAGAGVFHKDNKSSKRLRLEYRVHLLQSAIVVQPPNSVPEFVD
jgi:hypothetical protein